MPKVTKWPRSPDMKTSTERGSPGLGVGKERRPMEMERNCLSEPPLFIQRVLIPMERSKTGLENDRNLFSFQCILTKKKKK